ncbi:MAG: hypothetical protein WDN30_13155 [Pararobbsia sp.]
MRALNQEALDLGKAETEWIARQAAVQRGLRWRDELAKAGTEREHAQLAEQQAQLAIQRAKPDLDRLAAGEPAEQLRAVQSAMVAARQAHAATARTLEQARRDHRAARARCRPACVARGEPAQADHREGHRGADHGHHRSESARGPRSHFIRCARVWAKRWPTGAPTRSARPTA